MEREDINFVKEVGFVQGRAFQILKDTYDEINMLHEENDVQRLGFSIEAIKAKIDEAMLILE